MKERRRPWLLKFRSAPPIHVVRTSGAIAMATLTGTNTEQEADEQHSA